MIFSGAASLPEARGAADGADLPDLDRLRVVLRPAELPLRRPRDVREAAGRVRDLVHSGRHREARALAEAFRTLPADPPDRLALLRAALHGALLLAEEDGVRHDAADIVSLLRRSGRPEQAAAVVEVLLADRPPAGGPSAEAAQGRRRGRAPQAGPEMLLVTRALEQIWLLGSEGSGQAATDLRGVVARLRAALAALPAVRGALLVDPEAELLLRLAQSLEGLGDGTGATTAALDALERIEQQGAEAGAPGEDPARIELAAHAVLARALGAEHPHQAVQHALAALDALPGIEDPPLRVGLITALLQALVTAGAHEQARYTADRLASLQRTVERDDLRTAPLLAVAAQRVHAGRVEAAQGPLEQARALARAQRDHRALMEAARLGAGLHERTGDRAAALVELRRLAAEARHLVDDLATPAAALGPLMRTELEANALAMRRALDLGRLDTVAASVRAIERRTRRDVGRPRLPVEFLWDHRVDARVGLFIATGDALLRGVEGVDEALWEARRRSAQQAVEESPPGHAARARYWTAYLEDRHAHQLAEHGLVEEARAAALRAREGWRGLGRGDDLARTEALLRRLAAG
ncbi:hypothetical protein [Brachybacterium sp. YJGR34]|uniref:hypothetical protein n=1 Tax=Brachybacterium sp. YJGR34 TaxID=2059911 RepID=UPI001E401FA0|nr:hypothetical protein [Brachybacterium sp. YJGR34]